MDLIKIGKFIASMRKDKGLTQELLAEKLYITDRAVSKWERGLSLPDADKMVDLCNILGININELLMGEKIGMEEDKKKTEELLIKLAKQEELQNKRLMANMWVIVIVTAIFYFGILLLATKTLEEGPVLGTIIVVSTLLFVITALYAFKLEVDAGYYECHNCHHRFVPNYFVALIAPHVHTIRFLKCPKCGKRTWAKKAMTRE